MRIASVALLLIACNYPGASPPAPTPVRTAAQVDDDRFDSTVTVNGVPHMATKLDEVGYMLLSKVNRHSGTARHYLMATETHRGEWIFWNAARLDDQSPLEFQSVQQKVDGCGAYSGCILTETFGAVLSEDLLRTRDAGIEVKFYSSTGIERVLGVGTTAIREQLRVVDSIRTTIKRP